MLTIIGHAERSPLNWPGAYRTTCMSRVCPVPHFDGAT
jgi:hypothetical protein